jgi:hypothetical protein
MNEEIKIDKNFTETEPQDIELAEVSFDLQKRIEELNLKLQEVEEKANIEKFPERLQAIKIVAEKISGFTKRFIRNVKRLALVVSAFGVINYHMTHENLEETIDKDGNIEYRHPDERTTHLLNCIAGRETLTTEDFLIDLRGRAEQMLQKKGLPVPANIDSMSEEELDDVFTSLHLRGGFLKDKKVETVIEEKEGFQFAPKGELKSNIYELVWQLEKECGNPYVRLATEGSGFNPLKTESRPPHYNALDNTIYLPIYCFRAGEDGELVYGEFAHAKQYNDEPVTKRLQGIRDVLGTVLEGDFSSKHIIIEHRKSYNEKDVGHIEYEAHKEIAPHLMNKYDLDNDPDQEHH